MAILQTDEANILDAEATNWRLIVYPILVALVVVVGGLGYYFYLQNQREELEASARAVLVQAKTPEELIKVADQFPGTDQATLALLGAAAASFDKRDYDAALKDYQQIAQDSKTNADLRGSAQIGIASSLEAAGKTDDAINAYLEVAQQDAKNPYAPFAYQSAARIYEERGDKDNEQKILSEAASLDPNSAFVKQAQYKLKELMAAAQPPMTVQVPPTPSTPASTSNAVVPAPMVPTDANAPAASAK
jgi:tetratricopeptide (TPR) repeat protein